jgi:hypothetical protein
VNGSQKRIPRTGATTAPALSAARSRPKARPNCSFGTDRVSSRFRSGPRQPLPAQPIGRTRTSHGQDGTSAINPAARFDQPEGDGRRGQDYGQESGQECCGCLVTQSENRDARAMATTDGAARTDDCKRPGASFIPAIL